MNQPAKSKVTSPGTETADSAGSDWGLDVPKKRGLTETRIGLLLVVCLVGALGYLTFRKLEERRHSPRGSDFHEPAAAANPDNGFEQSPVGEQIDSNPGQEAGWVTGLGDEPGFVDGSGSQTTTAVTADSHSLPPAQQEPDESASRTFANDPSLEFLNEQESPGRAVEPETRPLASNSDWNPFAADAPRESTQPDNVSSSHGTDAFGASGVLASDTNFDMRPDAASDWTENQETGPADHQDSTALELDTSSAQGGPAYTVESPSNESAAEQVFDLFGGESQRDAAAAVADVAVESSDGPRLEPLPVPAEETRLIPVASEGIEGDFTQHAAAETSGGDPWTSATPRALAQNSSPSAVEFELGGTSASPGADAATSPSSDPGFLPESGQSTAPVDTWNSGSNRASESTTAGSDPFSQTTTNVGTPDVGSDDITVHIVQSGDNFWTIAHKYYKAGRYANALAAFNQSRIPDPRKMRPGMKVLIPDRQVLIQRFPKLTGAAYGPGPAADTARWGFFVDRNGQPAYRVGKNDTLTGIAARHLGRSSRSGQILGMNRDQLKDAHSLKIGMVLKLPLDATQVSVVPETTIAR